MNVKRPLLPAVFVLGIISLWAIGGCSKNSSSSTSSGTFTCTINGTTFTSQSNLVVAGYLTSFGQIIIQGETKQSSDSTIFQVAIPYIPAVNISYSTDSIALQDLSYAPPGKEYDAYFGNGNSHAVVTLTQADTVNHKISGTFSGVLYNSVNSSDSVVIANGVFSSSYVVQ